MLHGDLSDYPETAVPQKYGGCVRRYPVNIIIGEKAGAELAFPSEAWIAYEDLAAALRAHDGDRGPTWGCGTGWTGWRRRRRTRGSRWSSWPLG